MPEYCPLYKCNVFFQDLRTHCDTRLKISMFHKQKNPPVGTLLPHSSSGCPPLLGWPNLSSVFPATIPKYDETVTLFTPLTRICEHPPHLVLSSTDCSFINKLPINTIGIRILIFFRVFLTGGSTREVLSPVLPRSLSGWPPLLGWPNPHLASVSPPTIPKIG